MQEGEGDGATNFRIGDLKYGTQILKVPVVVKPHIDATAATPSPITFGEHM
jgi:hypothetical protein